MHPMTTKALISKRMDWATSERTRATRRVWRMMMGLFSAMLIKERLRMWINRFGRLWSALTT